MGPRGDVIVELDWCVGEILATLDRLKLADDTLVIFTSDNGPVLDDGYADGAVELAGAHKPAGPLRGGKYSAFDAGTRVPLVARWPGRVRRGVSSALVCQIDFFSSLARLTGQSLRPADAPDSIDVLGALRGTTAVGREHLVEQGASISLIVGNWKYIEPGAGPAIEASTGIELGNAPRPQLFDLARDLGERRNVAAEHPDRVKTMAERLRAIRGAGRSR
jgi:arylsulfatase A-like enzyme